MPGPITQYASIADLEDVGISKAALRAIEPEKKTAALVKASGLMDEVFRARYVLPFTQVGASVAIRCAHIAAYLLMTGRGFNPEQDSDRLIRLNYEDAQIWLANVRNMKVTLDVTDSSPSPVEGKPTARARMVSSSSRGWSTRTTGVCDPGSFTGD
jgi:phage gp36-like protein